METAAGDRRQQIKITEGGLDNMKTFDYTITDPLGMHARPAGLFVKEAAKFPCKVTIAKDGKEVDAKRILGVMSLGVKQGMSISVTCDGDEEDAAAADLEKFLKENL
jgi:phosphocarrier protein HPr